MGGGGAINGQPLAKLSGRARNPRAALDLAAATLAKREAVPEEAVALMAKPIVPAWTYLLFGRIGWYLQAKRNGVLRQLDARPY